MSGEYWSRISRMVSLKVGNVSKRTTENDLKTIFERIGRVGDVFIPRAKDSNESRGFAFIRYYNERDANEAISHLSGYWLNGRILNIERARVPRHTRRIRGSHSSESRFDSSSRSPQHRSFSRHRSPVRHSHSRRRSSQRYSYSRSRSPQRYSYSRSRSPQRYSYSRSRSPSSSTSTSRSSRYSTSTSTSPQYHSYARSRSSKRRLHSRFRSFARNGYCTSRSYSRSDSNSSRGGYAASRSKS